MAIYDLSNIDDLKYDLDDIFQRIDSVFQLTLFSDSIEIKSKVIIDKNIFWASPEATEIFNKKTPFYKSLLKDMYAVIEAIFKNDGGFDVKKIEKEFNEFNYFRIFNNKLKHFDSQNILVDIIGLNNIEDENSSVTQEILCQYTFKDKKIETVLFSKFVILFLQILESRKEITLNRKKQTIFNFNKT